MLTPSKRKVSRTAAATIGLLAGSLFAASAFAGAPRISHLVLSSDQVPSVRVNFSDLNPATDEGAATLYRRIAAAASAVCAVSDSRDLAAAAASLHCRDRAIANAVHQLDSPQLAAAYAAHAWHG